MAQNDGVYVFDSGAAGHAASSIDPNLLLALQNGGGFGNGSSWIWIMFLWMMWNQNGRNGNFSDFVAQSAENPPSTGLSHSPLWTAGLLTEINVLILTITLDYITFIHYITQWSMYSFCSLVILL